MSVLPCGVPGSPSILLCGPADGLMLRVAGLLAWPVSRIALFAVGRQEALMESAAGIARKGAIALPFWEAPAGLEGSAEQALVRRVEEDFGHLDVAIFLEGLEGDLAALCQAAWGALGKARPRGGMTLVAREAESAFAGRARDMQVGGKGRVRLCLAADVARLASGAECWGFLAGDNGGAGDEAEERA